MKLWRENLTPLWANWWQGNQWRADGVLALFVGLIALTGTYLVGQNQPGQHPVDALAFVLLAAGATALAFRRRHPGWVLLFVNGVTLLYLLQGYPKGTNFLITIIAFYAAVMQGRRFMAWVVLLAEFVLFPWLPHYLGSEPAPSTIKLLGLAGWLLVLATVAEIAHSRQQRVLRTRDEAAHRRASEERLRIARDLHDVLGHNISLISVQAGVALHLMDQQPEQARIALSVIRDTSKETLGELRTVLDLLRQGHEDAPRAPSPRLANLGDLVARAEEAGLQVHTEITGDLQRLPASVDLAAFRVVQEALTNVMRHSGQSAVCVQVTRNEQALTLLIENAVARETASDPTDYRLDSGQGILGMRERATALGGVVEAGPRPNGGFRVFARLPLNRSPLISLGGRQ